MRILSVVASLATLGAASVPARSAAPSISTQPSTMQTGCVCVHNKTFTVLGGANCTVTITSESGSGSVCNYPTCNEGDGCTGSYTYFVAGTGGPNTTETLTCRTSCGGSCESKST